TRCRRAFGGLQGPSRADDRRRARRPAPSPRRGAVASLHCIRARAPASSANLGPGFDALAVALGLYVEVSVQPAERLSVLTTGEGADLPADASHLAARVAVETAGHDRLAITVHAEIPVGRGLGSSAALAVAAAAAAGTPDPLAVGARFDGHPDNAAAAAMGGLVAATLVDGRVVARRLPLDPDLMFVVVVPDRSLPTEQARAALPASVPHADAAFNLGRMGLLIAGLADHRQLVAAATEDRLHQGPRSGLFPQAAGLLKGLVDAGALAACWSGAGPSLLAVTTGVAAGAVAQAARELLSDAGIAGAVIELAPDVEGVVVTA
ncbi:MAG TPA: homoserine kinase, partial [Acidimicrobiales bacterium]|nr:homoserine kinase [Acidimicrobiales bacterium]